MKTIQQLLVDQVRLKRPESGQLQKMWDLGERIIFNTITPITFVICTYLFLMIFYFLFGGVVPSYYRNAFTLVSMALIAVFICGALLPFLAHNINITTRRKN